VDDCPFCARIAAGEFDYSDRTAVAFEPLNPVTEGHLLVVPRKHVSDAGADPVTAGQAMEFAAMIAGPLEFSDWHYNLITSAGSAATQTVRHLHIHLVPRREGDGLSLPWTGQQRPTGSPAPL
jgi:histidine triad (HIT) family protein